MAKANLHKEPLKTAGTDDIWDTISGAELKLNREETKIIFTLLGFTAHKESGLAGRHVVNVLKKIAAAVSPDAPIRAVTDLNLKLAHIHDGMSGEAGVKIVDRVTGNALF